MPDAFADAKVLVAGTALSEDYYHKLERLEVDLSLHLPGMAAITFYDSDLSITGSTSPLDTGKELEIKFKVNDVSDTTVFKGIITALEPVFEEGGSYCSFTVRAYDKLYALHRGRSSLLYTQVTDSDLVQRIAGIYSLTAQMQATSEVHEYVFRDNMSDYEFLQFLARRNGYVCYVKNGRELVFKPPSALGETEVAAEYGTNLLEFRPTVSLSGQPNSVLVRGWNRQDKQATVGESTAATFRPAQIGISSRGYQLAQSALGQTAKFLVADTVGTAGQNLVSAKAIHNRIASEDVTAEGTLLGTPALRAGAFLQVTAVSTRFSGKYFVTRVRHRFTPDDALKTEFWVGGMNAGTMSSLIANPPGRNPVEPRRPVYGLMIGVVTNANDPDGLFRVKVKFPTLGDDIESFWAPVMGIGAGATRGFMVLPEIGDEVLIAFEHGDIQHPYVLGGLWNGQDRPPQTQSAAHTGGKTEIREWKTRVGHLVRLTDKSGEEKIEVIDKTGKNSIVINSAQNTITVKSDKDIVLEAKQGAIKMEAMNIKMNATQGFEVAGATAKVESKGPLNLKGAQADLTGTALAKVSGPTVMIN